MPSNWDNPLETNQASCLSTLPYNAYLVLYNLLHLTIFLPLGKSTRSQVPFVIKE
jgi:hypothetical protein